MGHDILLTVLFGGARFGCCKQSLASLGVASMSSGGPYRPDDPDQQDRADEAGWLSLRIANAELRLMLAAGHITDLLPLPLRGSRTN